MAELKRPRPKGHKLWTCDEVVVELRETLQLVESWNGEIIRSPTPTPVHQEIVLNFVQRLKDFFFRLKLGKVYVSPQLIGSRVAHFIVHWRPG